MSAIQAVRVAARLKCDLDIEVEKIHGSYGEFKVEVDGTVLIDDGAWAALGFLPGARRVVRTVREALGPVSPPAPRPSS